MSNRYKGSQSAKAVQLAYPHHVDMVVPPGGLGRRLDAMNEFHTQHGIKPQRGKGRREYERDTIRWCFADKETAEAFEKEFGDSVER